MTIRQWLRLALGCVSLCVSAPSVQPGRRCVFLAQPQNLKEMEAGNVSGTVQQCAQTHCCAGYFQVVNGEAVAELQGCNVVETPCPNTTCFTSRRLNNHIGCVCNSDLCNSNITWHTEPKQPQLNHSTSTQSLNSTADILSATVVFIPIWTLLALCIVVGAVKLRHLSKDYGEKLPSSCHTPERSDIDLTHMELQQVVGQGHFASVWRGRHQGSTVAVKVFPAENRHEFTAEKEVFELPLMVHSGIVQFLGAGRRLEGGEWALVLELASCGSLNSFLSKNTCDWMTSLKLAQSLTQGLAFLHSDYYRHGLHKPAVAHRDISSNNVLVRADGTCALCDFGCSTILRPGRQSWQRHESTVLGSVQVGTLRYMSPEILEGCVNLSSGWCLLQGDVYALGLLLWELWMCCSDLFAGSPVPEHRLPYEVELGSSPTLEQLILLVSERRQRPMVPEQWEQIVQGFALQEILSDCWDHDSDARLTAQCAVNRLLSLPPCCSI